MLSFNNTVVVDQKGGDSHKTMETRVSKLAEANGQIGSMTGVIDITHGRLKPGTSNHVRLSSRITKEWDHHGHGSVISKFM